jgi:hypothetical protein
VRIYSKPQMLAAFPSESILGEHFMAVWAHQIHVLRAGLEGRNMPRKRVLHHLALAAGPEGRTMELDGILMDLAGEIRLMHWVPYGGRFAEL